MIDLLDRIVAVRDERRTRVRLCVAAYAYEMGENQTLDDAAFDALALSSDVTIPTGRFDDWWYDNFNPSSGQWVLSHPDIAGLSYAYGRLKSRQRA